MVFLQKWSFWGVLGVPPFKETPIWPICIYIYTWNMFVLYFGVWTLQEKALSIQNKGHLGSRRVNRYIYIYTYTHTLLRDCNHLPVWVWLGLSCFFFFALWREVKDILSLQFFGVSEVLKKRGNCTKQDFCSKNLTLLFGSLIHGGLLR